VSGLSTLADLWVGETFTGSCFSGTRTLKKLVPGLNALVADANAKSTTTGCSLTFASQAFAAGGTPQVTFDALGGQHGIGIEVVGSYGVIANNVFVWAHDTALQFDSNVGGHSITQLSIDNFCPEYRSDRTGILFKSGTNYNYVSGFNATCGGVFVRNQSAQPDVVDNVVNPGRVAGWVWGSVENDTGSLTISGMDDPDFISVSGQGNGDLFNINGQPLKIVNGSRFPSATYYSDTGGVSGLAIDSGSQIGGTAPVVCNSAGVTACTINGGLTVTGGRGGLVSLTGAQILLKGGTLIEGPTPTSCTPTGAGTGATCAFGGGSNGNNGIAIITAGKSASTSGAVAIVFSQSLPGGLPACTATYDDTGTAWNPGALPPHVSAHAASGITLTWNNNASALVASSTYRIVYHCFGK
jgi:hypothetical protein